MPRFKIIGNLVLKKKILKGFDRIWIIRPFIFFLQCDLNYLYKFFVRLPKEDPEQRFDVPSGLERIHVVLKMVDDNEGGQRTKEDAYTIALR